MVDGGNSHKSADILGLFLGRNVAALDPMTADVLVERVHHRHAVPVAEQALPEAIERGLAGRTDRRRFAGQCRCRTPARTSGSPERSEPSSTSLRQCFLQTHPSAFARSRERVPGVAGLFRATYLQSITTNSTRRSRASLASEVPIPIRFSRDPLPTVSKRDRSCGS